MDKYFTTEYFNDNTGRFLVTSLKTNKKYIVEPIETKRPESWGDIDPATKTSSTVSSKSKGSIKESESILLEENGFKNIINLGIGVSPLSYIQQLENEI